MVLYVRTTCDGITSILINIIIFIFIMSVLFISWLVKWPLWQFLVGLMCWPVSSIAWFLCFLLLLLCCFLWMNVLCQLTHDIIHYQAEKPLTLPLCCCCCCCCC